MFAITAQQNKRLNGATLIESIVAMILVLLCFVIASMVFVRVNNSATLSHQYLAKEWVNEWHTELLQIEETERNRNDWLLKRAFVPYGREDIWEMHYEVWSPAGELKYEEKRLKYIKKTYDEISEGT